MHPPARTTPPAAPTSNHTGVVPRWHLLAVAAAAYIAGRWGLDLLAGLAAITAALALLAHGALTELRRRDRAAAHLDSIDQRATVARLLEGDHP